MTTVDVLMITYRRPEYARLALEHLLGSATQDTRIWLWHNGDDEATLAEVERVVNDPRVAKFHHSRENVRLREPTNWLWANSDATYVSKVDDDCLVDDGWIPRLVAAHEANPDFGVIGSWRFPDEDFVPSVANRKIKEFAGGHRLLQNFWVQGSGYLMKRECIDRLGLLGPDQSFADYCIELALAGYVNGWPYPFVREEHMDDPRCPYTLLTSDEDLQRFMPLSAERNGVTDLASWTAQIRRSAATVQSASIDPSSYRGWRVQVARTRQRLRRLTMGKQW
jgi:GT2 family glycosyltransferase